MELILSIHKITTLNVMHICKQFYPTRNYTQYNEQSQTIQLISLTKNFSISKTQKTYL